MIFVLIDFLIRILDDLVYFKDRLVSFFFFRGCSKIMFIFFLIYFKKKVSIVIYFRVDLVFWGF